jgi:hypothetical protein
VKIVLSNNIRTALPSYILFNVCLSFLAGILIYGYLELKNVNPSNIGGLILIGLFSFIYMLSIIFIYFVYQKYIPVFLKVHPIFLIFFYFLSYSYMNYHASESVGFYWLFFSMPLVLIILLNYAIIIFLGIKKGWLIEK